MKIGDIEKAYALKNQYVSIQRKIRTIENEIDYLDANFVNRCASSQEVVFSIRANDPIMEGIIQRYIKVLERRMETIRKEIEAL